MSDYPTLKQIQATRAPSAGGHNTAILEEKKLKSSNPVYRCDGRQKYRSEFQHDVPSVLFFQLPALFLRERKKANPQSVTTDSILWVMAFQGSPVIGETRYPNMISIVPRRADQKKYFPEGDQIPTITTIV